MDQPHALGVSRGRVGESWRRQLHFFLAVVQENVCWSAAVVGGHFSELHEKPGTSFRSVRPEIDKQGVGRSVSRGVASSAQASVLAGALGWVDQHQGAHFAQTISHLVIWMNLSRLQNLA